MVTDSGNLATPTSGTASPGMATLATCTLRMGPTAYAAGARASTVAAAAAAVTVMNERSFMVFSLI